MKMILTLPKNVIEIVYKKSLQNFLKAFFIFLHYTPTSNPPLPHQGIWLFARIKSLFNNIFEAVFVVFVTAAIAGVGFLIGGSAGAVTAGIWGFAAAGDLYCNDFGKYDSMEDCEECTQITSFDCNICLVLHPFSAFSGAWQ